MLPHIRNALWSLVVVILAALLVGWLIDYPLDLLVCVLIGYGLWHIWQLNLLMRWVQRRMRGRPRFLFGPWRELANMLRRQRQRRQDLVRKMSRTVRRVSQLTHAIDEGIVVLASGRELNWWNNAAADLLNLRKENQGIALSHLVRDPTFTDYLEKEDFSSSLELASPTQPGRWLLFTGSHFGADEVVLVVMDITRLKRLEVTRKEFVANVSHELRTPLTVLKGYLETLGGGMLGDNPAVERACQQMEAQVKRMQALADDLVTLSHLEAQDDEPELEAVTLRPMFENIIEEGRVISDGRHEFRLECPEGLAVMGLNSELHSVVGNLVVNAVRHNPEGAYIELKAGIEANSQVTISVSDDGVGISAELIPRLTERFYRTDTSRSSEIAGTGLGLAIVKHGLYRMGSELEIQSQLGRGATFLCRFRAA